MHLDEWCSLLLWILILVQLILPVSSWAFWAGVFSNASEIHVNAYPHHQIMYSEPQYIYHDEKNKQFFGRWNASANDIQFALDTKAAATHALSEASKASTSEFKSVSPTASPTTHISSIAPSAVTTVSPFAHPEKKKHHHSDSSHSKHSGSKHAPTSHSADPVVKLNHISHPKSNISILLDLILSANENWCFRLSS